MTAMTHLTHKNRATEMKVCIMVNLSLALQLKLFFRGGRIDVHHLAPQAPPRCKPNFVGHLFIELGQKLRPVRFQIEIPTSFIAKRLNLTSKRFSYFGKSRGTCIDLPNQTRSGLEILELLGNMFVQVILGGGQRNFKTLPKLCDNLSIANSWGSSRLINDWRTFSSCR